MAIQTHQPQISSNVHSLELPLRTLLIDTTVKKTT